MHERHDVLKEAFEVFLKQLSSGDQNRAIDALDQVFAEHRQRHPDKLHALVELERSLVGFDNRETFLINLLDLLFTHERWESFVDLSALVPRINCSTPIFLLKCAVANRFVKNYEIAEQLFRTCLDLADNTAGADFIQAECSLGLGDRSRLAKYFCSYDASLSIAADDITIAPVISLATLSERIDADVMTFESSQDVEIKSSDGFSKAKYQTDPYRLISLSNSKVLSGWDFVVLSSNEVVNGSGYMPLEVFFRVNLPHYYSPILGLVAYRGARKPIVVDGITLFLSSPVDYHFGHWIVDFLPRLRAVKDPSTKIMIPNTLPTKHRDLLSLMGIQASQLFECEVGKVYEFGKLIVPLPGKYIPPNPNTVRFVHDRLRNDERSGDLRLFLTRGAGTRLLVNQSEVDIILKNFEFTSVDMSLMSIKEQRDLMKNVEIIVSAFGSDLFASYFASPGLKIIELIWDPSEDECTAPTAAFMGHDHQFLICKGVEPKNRRHKKDRDMIVDCDALSELLQNLLTLKKE